MGLSKAWHDLVRSAFMHIKPEVVGGDHLFMKFRVTSSK